MGNRRLFARWTVPRLTMLTVKQAAAILHVSEDAVRKYIAYGKLPATKFGSQIAIDEQHLSQFQSTRRKPGRPPKQEPK
jgi:excisionase family DNA binding protein